MNARRVLELGAALASFCASLLAVGLLCAGSADAASFDLVYDDLLDVTIGTDHIVGTGTFGYAGPATVGSFPLSALSGMTFSATFNIPLTLMFTTADILSNPATTGISVFSLGGGQFGLVFTGNGGTASQGSLDLRNEFGDEEFAVLSHEATSAISDPIGCCFGNGATNAYFVFVGVSLFGGDYSARTAPVPEPGTLALAAVGLLTVAAKRVAGAGG